MCKEWVVTIAALASAILLPVAARAQGSGITGVVRDSTGGVLPGVTVEAASPALIEKVRTVLTGGGGEYTVVDLRPGTYTVTFSLAGFSTVRREGIELNSGFTATVNAELQVGALDQAITVTGAAPTVDIRNVRTQNVISGETFNELPTGKTPAGIISLIVGASSGSLASQDVGGNRGDGGFSMAIHGGRPLDAKMLLDGMNYNNALGPNGGGFSFIRPNQAAAQEIVVVIGGISAESETGGIQMNLVPKEGGNTFRGEFYTNGTGPAFQGSNLTDALRARGLNATPGVKQIYDVGGGFGGPITKDKLWFYAIHRWWGADEFQPGNYYNKTPNTLFYTPDLSRPAYTSSRQRDTSLRLTWQASSKHKFTFSESFQDWCSCGLFITSNYAPEAAVNARGYPEHLIQSTWSYPATSRVLVQAGVSYNYSNFSDLRQPETARDAISIRELSTGYIYNAAAGFGFNDYADDKRGDQTNGRFSVSYVTGSHAFKTGLFFLAGGYNQKVTLNDPPISYEFLKPTADAAPNPVSVTYWASPQSLTSKAFNLGLYAQDQWTLRKLTLNLGVRFDYLEAWNPEQTRPAGPFVAALHVARQDNVPNWRDLSPRLGVAYDVFGNSKTALKASLGRYVIGEATSTALAVNPAGSIVTNAKRTWNDANGDYIPQEAELGPLSNSLFGTVQVNTHYAANILSGFGVRPYSWEGTVSVDHELRPGVGLTVGYYRRSYGNFTVTSNAALTPTDFDFYCLTAPVDPRLPGGGGNQLCGLFDVKPGLFGKVNNLVTHASDYGKQTEVYNGVDVVLNARFGNGGTVSGGVNTGRTVFNNCYQNDAPQLIEPILPNYTAVAPGGGGQSFGLTPRSPAFCRAVLPFKGQTQVKFGGSYPLPWDLEASAVFQNLSGVPIAAGYSFTNSQIAPSLGRNLGACGTAPTCTASVAINLLPPYTQFEDRLTQVDLRVTKIVRFGKFRLKGMFDVYNAFNASTILGRVQTLGPRWGLPIQVLGARLLKVGGQVDF